jgi:hypothetical protein
VTGNLFDALVEALGRFLVPLRDAVGDAAALDGLLGQIGATTQNAGGDALATALAGLLDAADQISEVASRPSPSFADLEALTAASRTAFTALRGVSEAGGPAAALDGLGTDLADLLILLYLWNWHRLAYKLAVLATVIEPASETEPRAAVVSGGTVLRRPFELDQFRPHILSGFLRDPVGTLRAEYGDSLATVEDADAVAEKLFPRVRDVLRELGVSCRYGFDPADAPLLGDSAPIVDHALIVYVSDPLLGEGVEAGVVLTLSSADRGDLGLVVSPFGTLTETFQAGPWNIEIDLTADVRAFAYGRHGLSLLASPDTAEVSAKFTATLQAPDGGPAFVIGSPAGSRLEIGGARVAFQATLSDAHLSFAASADVLKSALVITGGDGDGFLRNVLPADGPRVEFDLGLAWSREGGFVLRGAGGLDATLPVGISIGDLLTVPTIHIGLRAADSALAAEVSASIGLAVGPVQALVDRVGLTSSLVYGEGSVGVGDWDFAFKAPSGIGLVIDADGVLSGAGFIGRDPATGRYSGGLDLHAGQVGITAFGLLDTNVPAGDGDYSLLVALGATFPSVEIGFGFALTGVGGLIALNRRVNVDVLRARLASGTAGRVLAPQDPVHNAPALLADLDAVFPRAAGITVVGPTAQVVWAELVHLDVGLFIELPGPARVVLLGSVHAVIEHDGRALLSVRLDVLGVVDLRGRTAAVDAVLIDSHLFGMLDLTGGAAFRLSWGEQPYVVLSLGGFHPAFHPEPMVFPPSLTRIAMVHGSPGDEVYLRFEGYLAITANTRQFGANIDAVIRSGGFVIEGILGFDALIQIVPLHFEIDIRASVHVSYHDYSLGGLTLTGSLSGPGPVVLRAKVCIELLFFDICFSGTFNLGAAVATLAAVAADLLTTLLGELDNPATLRAVGPPDPHVRLRPPAPSLTVPVVPPTGMIAWEQRRAPLDLVVTRMDNARLPAPVRVSATSSTTTTPVADWFAPGQFTDLTDDQALTRPSYERLTSGVQLGGQGVVDGPTAVIAVTILEIRPPVAPSPGRPAVAFPAWLLTTGGNAGPDAPAITVRTESWTVTAGTTRTSGLTGAAARHLAAHLPDATATPAVDRLPAFSF